MLRRVIGPQALRVAVPPTVGFLVQVIKETALASVIGFIELTKAATMITEMSFASGPDRVVFMHAGCIREIGPPTRIVGSPQTPELRQFLAALDG